MKGEFHIRADLPCQYLLCPDFTKNRYYFSVSFPHQSVGGKVVSIAAFQAVDLGSIPDRRNNCYFV